MEKVLNAPSPVRTGGAQRTHQALKERNNFASFLLRTWALLFICVAAAQGQFGKNATCPSRAAHQSTNLHVRQASKAHCVGVKAEEEVAAFCKLLKASLQSALDDEMNTLRRDQHLFLLDRLVNGNEI